MRLISMECVVSQRHQVAPPRVWQPWYIGGDEVVVRDCRLKDLPTKKQKLRRNRERRHLIVSFRKGRAKKNEMSEEGGELRDEDSPDMASDDDGEGPMDEHTSDSMADDSDSPLDMTTGNRQRGRDVSPSPTSRTPPLPPPSLPSPMLSSPSPFCPNPHARYGPFSPSAPPPYHPVAHHQQHRNNQLHLPRHRVVATTTLPAGSSSPPANATHLQQRPSVITCASALLQQRSSSSVSQLSRRTLSDPTPTPLTTSHGGTGRQRRGSADVRHGHRREILSGMCDPVIDEHFRRSLGKDYPEFLASSSSTPPPPPSATSTASVAASATQIGGGSASSSVSVTGMSVDDHFAKALGETWLRLQGKMTSSSCSPASTVPSSSGSPSPVASGTTSSPPSPALQQRRGVVSS